MLASLARPHESTSADRQRAPAMAPAQIA
jgi:hypothetical protein